MLPPLRLTITDQPTPAVTITSPTGQTFDVTPHLELLALELHPQRGTWVTLTLAAEVDWDFPVQRVAVTGDPLEGITEAELTSVLTSGGMSSSPAARVLAHLRARMH